MLQDPNLKITITIERLKRNSITVDSIKNYWKIKNSLRNWNWGFQAPDEQHCLDFEGISGAIIAYPHVSPLLCCLLDGKSP